MIERLGDLLLLLLLAGILAGIRVLFSQDVSMMVSAASMVLGTAFEVFRERYEGRNMRSKLGL